MKLRWSNASDPVQTNENLTLPQFELLDVKTHRCHKSYITGRLQMGSCHFQTLWHCEHPGSDAVLCVDLLRHRTRKPWEKDESICQIVTSEWIQLIAKPNFQKNPASLVILFGIKRIKNSFPHFCSISSHFMTEEIISRSHMSRRNWIDNFHQCAFCLGTNIVCKLLTFSDSYMVDEMLLRWKRFIPVQINDELELPQFILVAIATTQCSQSYITGEWLWPSDLDLGIVCDTSALLLGFGWLQFMLLLSPSSCIPKVSERSLFTLWYFLKLRSTMYFSWIYITPFLSYDAKRFFETS